MIKSLIYGILIFNLTCLAGCAHHLSQVECVNRDWYATGLADGRNGSYKSNLQGEIQDCSKFNIPVNTDAYSKGWNEGIRSYCNFKNGLILGAAGKGYKDFCPSDLKEFFSAGWQEGIQQYCTPERAYELGRKGKSFPQVCPAHLKGKMSLPYEKGKHIFQKISEIEHDISKTESQIRDCKWKIETNKRSSFESSREEARKAEFLLPVLEQRLESLKSQKLLVDVLTL